MKKVTLFGSFLIVCWSLLLISCPISFSLNSNSRSTLNLQFNIPSQMQSESRAILGPDGFLYIRTLGGPVGDSGPAYGPYTLSGGEVTINDIPAGSYSSMVFLHSTFNLAGKTLTVNKEEMTVEKALTLSDAEYTQYILGASNTEAFYALIDGLGSQGKTGPISIMQGNNAISVTLIPLCSPQSTVTINMTNSMYNGNYETDVSRFIQLEFDPPPTTWKPLLFTVATNDPQAPFVLYSKSGARISNFSYNGDFDGFTGSVQTSALPLYLYVGVLSETLSFDAKEYAPQIVVFLDESPVTSGDSVNMSVYLPDSQYEETITINNNGNDPLIITNASISGSEAEYFTITPKEATIPPSDTRDFILTFTPVSFLDSVAQLTISSNDPEDPEFILNLDGFYC